MLLWGFGFTNAAILGWLAAAAAPLLIHLWNRRRYREVRWAAMQYLLAAARKNARRLRIEHALLLLVRTLAIVLAVPVSLGIAIFLSELSPAWLRTPISRCTTVTWCSRRSRI